MQTNVCVCVCTGNQWLEFDIGPATLVTGVVTRGRGDGRRKHWVTRFRLSYTNDTQNAPWRYYDDTPSQLRQHKASCTLYTSHPHPSLGSFLPSFLIIIM